MNLDQSRLSAGATYNLLAWVKQKGSAKLEDALASTYLYDIPSA
jgi:hypothetical protein